MPKKRAPKVQIKWRDRSGGRYAVLRWTQDKTRRERALGYVTAEEAEVVAIEARLRALGAYKTSEPFRVVNY